MIAKVLLTCNVSRTNFCAYISPLVKQGSLWTYTSPCALFCANWSRVNACCITCWSTGLKLLSRNITSYNIENFRLYVFFQILVVELYSLLRDSSLGHFLVHLFLSSSSRVPRGHTHRCVHCFVQPGLGLVHVASHAEAQV